MRWFLELIGLTDRTAIWPDRLLLPVLIVVGVFALVMAAVNYLGGR